MKSVLSILAFVGVLGAGCRPRSAPAPDRSAASAPSDTAASQTPSPPATEDPAGVIERYYAAIGTRDFQAAYALWEGDGTASGQTFEAFVAGFSETVRVNVEVGSPGRVEGAAGSQYVVVPVVVRATTTAGAAQQFEGRYTLRRSMVDGATPVQRRWRLYTADLAPSR